jgi:hypothetical protein
MMAGISVVNRHYYVPMAEGFAFLVAIIDVMFGLGAGHDKISDRSREFLEATTKP